MNYSQRGVKSYKIYSFTSGNEQFQKRKRDWATRKVYLRDLKKDEKKSHIKKKH